MKSDTPTQDAAVIGHAMGLRGPPRAVRSKMSGHEGLAYVDDPHVFIEGPGIAGWYRPSEIPKQFLDISHDPVSFKR